MDRIRNQNINRTMADETPCNNQNVGMLIQLIQEIPIKIEVIEHDVLSTKHTVELMAVKLDDLINKLDRRDFLDDPSQQPHGTIERNEVSGFGPLL